MVLWILRGLPQPPGGRDGGVYYVRVTDHPLIKKGKIFNVLKYIKWCVVNFYSFSLDSSNNYFDNDTSDNNIQNLSNIELYISDSLIF